MEKREGGYPLIGSPLTELVGVRLKWESDLGGSTGKVTCRMNRIVMQRCDGLII